MKKLSLTLISILFLGLTAPAKNASKKAVAAPQVTTEIAPPPAGAMELTQAAPPTPAVVFEGVQLAPIAKIGAADLRAVSHGIRRKKVFGLVSVDVYVAEFYAQYPDKLQKSDDQVLNSLPTAGPVQIKLTLMRDLSGSDISKSFKEALKENDVDLSKPVMGLSDLMTEVESVKSFKKGEVFSLSGDWKENHIVVQRPDQTTKTILADSDGLKKMFSIWLGKPVDDKMQDLKKNLLK